MTIETKASCTGCASGAGPKNPRGGSAIERRTFLVQSAMMAAAAALAACGASDATSPTLAAGTSIKVGDYAALSSVGGVAMVTVSGAKLAIVRTGSTAFVALSRVCPHQGGIVNQNGAGFLCPEHGATFSLTGAWTGGEHTSSLHSYATSYDAAIGMLSIG